LATERRTVARDQRRGSRRAWPLIAWAFLVAGSPGCEARRSTAPARPLTIELSGCAAVRRGGACVAPSGGSLRVFVRGGEAGDAPSADTDVGDAVIGAAHPVENGAWYEVRIDPRATRLCVRDRAKQAAACVVLAREGRDAGPGGPSLAEQADTARHAGDIPRATELAERLRRGADAEDRARGLGLLARLALRANDTERARALFAEAIDASDAAGLVSEAADLGFALAYAMIEARRFAEARAALDRADLSTREYPDGRARAAYYRGLFASQTGQAGVALDAFRAAQEGAARLGLTKLYRATAQTYALALRDLGRPRDGLALFDALARSSDKDEAPCERAGRLVSEGWTGLAVLRAHDGGAPVDARAPLEAALALYATACPAPRDRVNVLHDLAFVSVAEGDAADARRLLLRASAERIDETTGIALDALDLEGEIALLERAFARAAGAFGREAALAGSALAFEQRWRAEVGRGRAFEGLGDHGAALAAYAAAERQIDEESRVVPLLEASEAFVAARDAGARAAVDLLVRLRRNTEAESIARHARTRTLRWLSLSTHLADLSPDARARWEGALGEYCRARDAFERDALDDWRAAESRAADGRARKRERQERIQAVLDRALARDVPGALLAAPRPAPPPAGTLTLTLFPAASGWLAFASDARTTRVVHLDASAPASKEAIAGLLEEIAPMLPSARRLRVMPYGAMRAVDFHAAIVRGAPLVAALPVEYALDLGGDEAPLREPRGRAVIVADTLGNLPATRREAAAIHETLAAPSPDGVRMLLGPSATREAVLAELVDADLLHFAGHGAFDSGPLGKGLVLVGGARMTATDVLTLPRVPRLVVLSGCELARQSDAAVAEGLGVAQAFLLSGADTVIASTRPVDDATTAALMRALYRDEAFVARRDLAGALAHVEAELGRAGGNGDWSAFRAIRR
jgi:tetratricopeptide (TPR) repeat protein